MDLKLLFS